MANPADAVMNLPEFRNEPYTDFTQPANRKRMEEALAKVRGQLGREYDLLIGGERVRTADKLKSINPARPDEVVGIHQKATPELANRAIETAHRNFAAWSRTPAEDRVRMLLKTAALIRERKFEFDAWLVFEAGKTWPEAEAEVAEAIDFCEYYAREMLRLAGPQTVVQLPGERDEMRYLPLGVGVVIPPWNFPLAILCGMACAALVTGNTVVIKPSSETPTDRGGLRGNAARSGFPAAIVLLPDRQRRRDRRCSGVASEDAFHLLHRLARRRVCTSTNWPRSRRKVRSGSSAWWRRWAARTPSSSMRDCDLDAAVEGVAVSAFGYQGQKCSACSRAIVDAEVYDQFLEKLKARTEKMTVGEPDDPANYMGPVISAGAKKSIQEYIETGKSEGRVADGRRCRVRATATSCRPTVIADVDSKARIFQEEIFGPVLAVTKARDFDHALEMANDSQYGLTGAIYSNDAAHIARARDEFFVGNMYINRKCTGRHGRARIRSADSTCRARIRRPADRTTCCSSCRRSRSPQKIERSRVRIEIPRFEGD